VDQERDKHGLHGVHAAVTEHYDRLSPGQRRVIDRLLSDTRYAAVVSAPELAHEVGVSASTVTRAAQALGFAGYPDLQARLRQRFVDGVPERVEASLTDLGDTPEAAAIRVMLEDAESVRVTAEDLDPATLSRVVDLLIGARRVYVFGSRGSFGLALILAIGLRLLLADARLLSETGGDLPDQLLDMNAEDVLVAISFRRVDRATVDVLKHAARAGATSVGVGDHLSGPLARTVSRMLVARTGPLRLMPSYAVGASLINALATAVSVRRHGAVAPHLRAAEQLWDDFGTYAEA
jgi:DNA-binding MurR/RpiR family transcriptional regulator